MSGFDWIAFETLLERSVPAMKEALRPPARSRDAEQAMGDSSPRCCEALLFEARRYDGQQINDYAVDLPDPRVHTQPGERGREAGSTRRAEIVGHRIGGSKNEGPR